jgi:hypothetical protein
MQNPTKPINFLLDDCRYVRALSHVFYYVMHLILQKMKQILFFYNASQYELNMFANAFVLKGVLDALSLFVIIDTKKYYSA